MLNCFGSSLENPNLEATEKLREITGINDLNVYGYGFSGLKMVDLDKQDENVIGKLENAYQHFPNNDTLFFVEIGGNDITSMSPSRAYTLITPEQLQKFQSDLNAVFEKANERNNDVIISDITFRSYRNPLEINSAENFIVDFSGSGPYIENEFRPRQIEHQPHFLNTDNKSVVDSYNFIRNNWTALLHTDGVHLNSSSYTALQEFILERVSYLFTDTNMPNPVEIDFNQHSDLIVIDIGTIDKNEYNDRSAIYHPINFSAITSIAPVTTLLKTITGKDIGNLILDTSITDLNQDNIGVSTNTILPEDENASYKNWDVYSKEIMETALYFSEGESLTIKLTGLEINSEYDINFVGSTSELDGGTLKLKNNINLNEDEILTTSTTPEIGHFIAETNSLGELELTATSSSGRGYLSGISVEYIGPVQFEEVIVGETSDAGVRYRSDTGLIQVVDLTNDGLHIGNRSSTYLLLHKVIYVFKLPEIPSGKTLDNVTFSFYHSGRDGFNNITYQVDLRGIRYNSNSGVVISDYNANGTLIQEGILNVPLAPPRGISTSETGSLNLKNWINELYNEGATAGDYIFLKLEPDSIPGNTTINSFKVDSANNLDENRTPKLLLEYAISSYTVNFKDWNGGILKTETVSNGGFATAPTDPTRIGYTFIGWDTNFNNIISDLNVTAQYTVNSYTVNFKDWNGDILKTEDVNYGFSATSPTEPIRTGYTFIGWLPSDFTSITQDTNIIAQYTINSYTVNFKDWNGDILKTEDVNYGFSATSPTEPTRTGYTFIGWLPSDFTFITQDTNIIAQYTINSYIVNFKDWNGDILKTEDVNYGFSATSPTNPTRTGYTFIGWLPSDFTSITQDTNIIAQYTINQYTITFDTNGGSEISSITQDYNTVITPPTNPTKTGYTFESWSPVLPSNMPSENSTHIAQYILNNLQNTVNDINFEGIDNITLDINNSIVQGNNYISGLSKVKLSDSYNTILEFDHNFLETNLDLSKITIQRTDTSIIVNLSDQLQNDKNKTIYLPNNNFSRLCVKDQPLLTISQISSSCDQNGEYDFTQCIENGSYDYNGVSCIKVGDIFKFDNLRHSGVLGVVLSSSGNSGGSSNNRIPLLSLKVLNIDLNNFCKNDLLNIKISSKSYIKKATLNILSDLNTTIYSGNIFSDNPLGDLKLFDTIKLSKGNYKLIVSSDGFLNKKELFTIIDCNVSLDTNEDNIVIIPQINDKNISEEDSLIEDNNASSNNTAFKQVKSSYKKLTSNSLIYSLIAIVIILIIVVILFIYFRK